MENSRPTAENTTSAYFAASPDDMRLVEQLRNGDESAFMSLVEQYQNSLLRLAQLYAPNRTVAEEVVQETWLGVLEGIHRFEGRSSLKTWLFSILTNRAKTRGQRENRYILFAEFWNPDSEEAEPSVDPQRFHPTDHPQLPGHWASGPTTWSAEIDAPVLSREIRECIQAAIETLPPSQHEVITLHDIEDFSSDEVCNVLGISETNQRVLLHRARCKVRRALEQYFAEN